MNGVELIVAERQRQIDVEGWTPEHDDEHNRGELGRAAGCYLTEGWTTVLIGYSSGPRTLQPPVWPWDKKWWKPSNDPIRNLVKAGALIAAEIDRLQRIKP